MTAGAACSSGGTGLRENAKFCDECGAPTSVSADTPEYKQVTVLFADVVRSMDIAAAVGAERLREIMAEVVGRGACSAAIGAGSAQSSGFPRSPRTASARLATLIDDRGLSARIGDDPLGHARPSMTQDRYMARGKLHTQVAQALDDAISVPKTSH